MWRNGKNTCKNGGEDKCLEFGLSTQADCSAVSNLGDTQRGTGLGEDEWNQELNFVPIKIEMSVDIQVKM